MSSFPKGLIKIYMAPVLTLLLYTSSYAISPSQLAKDVQGGQDFVLSFTSNDKAHRFDLVLQSNAKAKLCVDVDDWPNNLGQVSGGPGRATFKSNRMTFTAADTNFGYCVGQECTIRIPPGDVLRGFVGYDQFGNVDQITLLPDKMPHYDIRPYVCKE